MTRCTALLATSGSECGTYAVVWASAMCEHEHWRGGGLCSFHLADLRGDDRASRVCRQCYAHPTNGHRCPLGGWQVQELSDPGGRPTTGTPRTTNRQESD